MAILPSKTMQLVQEHFYRVYQKDIPEGPGTIVALFLLETDALNWVLQENGKDPGLYFYTLPFSSQSKGG